MGQTQKVSLPISSVPISLIFLAIFAAFNILSLVVDTSNNVRAREGFYLVKSESTYFKLFNLFFLCAGILTYSLNFVFAFLRSSPAKRRISDFFGFFIFFSGIYIAIMKIVPLEKAYVVSGKLMQDDIAFFRKLSLGLQFCQLIQQVISYKNQGPAPKKVVAKKSKNKKE
jgi:hypothetical protein